MSNDVAGELALMLKEEDSNMKVEKLNKFSYINRYTSPPLSFEAAENALKISAKLKNKTEEAISKMHMAFSKFLQSADFPILQYLTEAHKILSKSDKIFDLALILNYMGNVYESYGEYQKALQFAQESLRLATQNKLKETEGDAHGTVGLIFSRLSDYKSAIANFQKSLKIREKLGNQHAMASSLNLIARNYALNEQFEKSEEFYQKAIVLRENINDTGALPWSYLGLASLFEKQEKLDKAIEFYKTSIQMNSSSGDKRCRLHCFLGLAEIYFKKEVLTKVIEYLDQALEIAAELNAKPILFDIHRLYAEYFEKQGNDKVAFEHFKKYHELKEEVLNTQMHNKLKNQQISFEVEKSQKEAEIYHLKNVELKKAFAQIEKKNEEILDSITYAKNIQNAVMLPETYLQNSLNDYFILFMPRDIVSGDFYWSLETEKKIYIAAADCTGHGVPGAFMSMLGMTFINEIVQNNPQTSAGEILNMLRSRVIMSLRQSDDMTGSKDGMDISFCVLYKYENLLEYAGAYNPLYIIENGEFSEIKANRMPIGHHPLMHQNFTNHFVEIRKGMCFYIFSDGYPDQFGGETGKKFMSKNLKKLLTEIHEKPMEEQKEVLENRINKWKEGCSQTDDILLIGFRI